VGADQHAFRDDSFKFSVGPLITWEFPDRTRVQARIHGAEADREGALARFDGVVLSALKETESALEVHARDQERREILQSARTQAQDAARDTQRQFEAGRIGYLPVLDALRTLAQVEQSVAAAESRVPPTRSTCSWHSAEAGPPSSRRSSEHGCSCGRDGTVDGRALGDRPGSRVARRL
jgi:outer membrane protein TolC